MQYPAEVAEFQGRKIPWRRPDLICPKGHRESKKVAASDPRPCTQPLAFGQTLPCLCFRR
jgi:hypothetical protein